MLAGTSHSLGSSVYGFQCVVADTRTNPCSDSLRGNGTPGRTAVSTAGYYFQSDGGAGEFYQLGSASARCATYPGPGLTGNFTLGKNTVTGLSGTIDTSKLSVGELVNSPNVPQGAEIGSISTTDSHTITMTLPATISGTNVSINIFGDNGGTLIIDGESPPKCYQKSNYRGEPHEWGAYGDGSTNDTTALLNWLGAYGNATSLVPPANGTPGNYGPWIATIPSIYKVKQPLVCPPNANIQAQANLSAGGGTGSGSPPVQIVAAGGGNFTDTLGLPGVIMASDFCRLSGISVDASNIPTGYLSATGSTSGNTVTISGASWPAFVVPGVPIGDTLGCIPAGAAVTNVNNSTTVTISLPTTTCGSDSITVTGFYAVDVVGTHVAIDNHSLLKGGYDEVWCLGFDGLQVKDTQIVGAYDDGLDLNGCSNVRLIGDLISGNGANPAGVTPAPHGRGVYSQGSDVTVSNGVIEQSGGIGLDLETALQVTVTGMYFDNNGKQLGGAAIQIGSSKYVSICGNHVHRSGGDAPGSSQIYFAGTSDNIDFCGNVYYPDNNPNEATLKPSFAYDAASGTVLTNTHLYEQPNPQAGGAVYSSAAAPLLTPLQVPLLTNEFTGFTLSNDTSIATKVDIGAGAAADSRGTALIQDPACTVDIGSASNGPGFLDVGSVAASTTYNYFAISSAGGSNGGTPATSCMASLSLAPSFINTGSPSPYALYTQAQAQSGSITLYNVPSVAGVKPNDLIVSSGFIPTGTTVTAVGTQTMYFEGSTDTANPSCSTSPYNCIDIDTTNLQSGMAISDNPNNSTATTSCTVAGQGAYQNPTTIDSIVVRGTSGVAKLSSTVTGILTNDCITVSGGNTITLSAATTSNAHTPASVTIYTGLYRMLGSLYTDASSNVVKFTQDGDTFYLKTPVNDVNASVGPISPAAIVLSVPNGVVVEALGRCVGGTNHIILYTPSTAPGTPGAFPTAPGYDVQLGTAPATAFPYRIHTNTSREIFALADVGGTTLQCETDGWVWQRIQ